MNILLSTINKIIKQKIKLKKILKILSIYGIEIIKTTKIKPINYYKGNNLTNTKQIFLSKITKIYKNKSKYSYILYNKKLVQSKKLYKKNSLILGGFKKNIIYSEYDYDYIIKINCTPNINYLLYYINICYYINCYLNFINKKHKLFIVNKNKIYFKKYKKISINIENNTNLIYLNSFLIKIKNINTSFKIFNNLLLSGNYKINNNISDYINYLMDLTGIPLVFLGLNKNSNNISIKINDSDLKFYINKDKFLFFKKGSGIFIYNNNIPINYNGILNSYYNKITHKTKKIILLIFIYNNTNMLKCIKKNKINNNITNLYKNKINIYNINYLIYNLKKIFRDNIYHINKLNNITIKEKKIFIYYNYITKYIGIKIKRKKIIKIIKSLNYRILNFSKNKVTILINNYLYIENKVDIIANIVKFLNINKIKNKKKVFLLNINNNRGDNKININIVVDTIINILINKGFNEVINSPFVKNKTLKSININKKFFLRTSLYDSLKNNIFYNLNRKNYNLKFYEVGKGYKLDKHKKYIEKNFLEFIIIKKNKNALNKYFRVYNIVKIILEKLNIKKYITKIYKNHKISIYIKKSIIVKLKPFIIKKYLTFYCKIFIERIIEILKNKNNIKIKKYSRLQNISKDLTFIINKNIYYNDFYKITKKYLNKLLLKLKLIDIYKKNLPENKKSYTFRLIIKNKIGLNKKSINNILKKIINLYEKQIGAEIKKNK